MSEYRKPVNRSDIKQHGFRLRMKPVLMALLFFASASFAQAEGLIHHEMKIALAPDANLIHVVDRISLPPSLKADEEGKFHFTLHEGLFPVAFTAGVVIERESGPGSEIPLSPDPADPDVPLDPKIHPGPGSVPVARYVMTLPIGLREVVISYEGVIYHPLPEENRLDTTADTKTPGLISDEGIFLTGQSRWYPDFDNHLLAFTLDISLPNAWSAVSQGERTQNRVQGETRKIRWESPEPQEEIFLVGGEWTEYQRQAGRVQTLAFLKNPDPDLANRYLKTTEQYLAMYQKLLGPYPYQKFAVVENFWETGIGLPSLTVLGPRTLRLSTMPGAAYAHELLRNWWGHGVFVDQERGDWSEGLTAYLSDYLIQEQGGAAQALRLTALQQYARYVSSENDFPLALFQSWNDDSASRAVGYGKSFFLFHMLRQSVGTEAFIEGLRTFFRENHFKRASFEDLAQAFSRAARKDLSGDFMQWVTRAGAPVLRARMALSEKTERGYLLTALLEQRQRGPAYPMTVPVSITLQDRKTPFQTTVVMTEKTRDLSIDLPARPVRLQIDPEYDLFRTLHPTEIPPSIERALNAESSLILLPSTASTTLKRAYQKLARSMKQDRPDNISIGWDNEYQTLPDDRAIWLLGWENRFQRIALKQLRRYSVSTNSAMTRIDDVQIPRRGHSLIMAARHPKRAKHALTWIAADRPATIPMLGEKLTEYGPYGYLAFRSDTLKNIEKGRWPPVGSPMSIRIKQADGKWIKEVPATRATRQALTSLPPLFSEDQMWRDIAFLSSHRLKGRGFGSPELDRAAEYLASSFRQAGLSPADDAGRSYLQQWKGENGGVGSGVALKNVVAMLPGSAPGLDHEYIVIGAHYDHLGFGWPRVREGDEGMLHPGANGNASGVALLLELARILKKEQPLKRSILFVAFTAKEVGLRGSKHLISTQHTLPASRIIGMINLDSIGRLEGNRLFALGTGSSRAWPPLLRRAGFETGVEIAAFPEILDASDHTSFINAGIPAIQFFTGITPETDRPTDTLEKINVPGMVAVGRVVKEVIVDLANRPASLLAAPGHQSAPPLIWERRTPSAD